MTLANNPSHLEAVDGVVEGRTRALQTDHDSATADARHAEAPRRSSSTATRRSPAQGVVAEVLNLQALAGYSTGGTIHLIANNQIGFTTDPSDGRSTRYASDLAKGFDVPIVHVNADDVEACMAAVRLAIDFRRALRARRAHRLDRLSPLRAQRSRRAGVHAAADVRDASRSHPTVRELFAAEADRARRRSRTKQVDAMSEARATARIAEAHAAVKNAATRAS